MTTNTQAEPQFGIITALPEEYAAVKIVLDNTYQTLVGERGGRQFLIGQIPSRHGGNHTVAVAILPAMANNSAAARATQLLERFPTIRRVLMVGIAGAAPKPSDPEEHVRLGDIVVVSAAGIVQYDHVAEKATETVHRVPPRPPSAELVEAAAILKAGEYAGERPWLEVLERFRSHGDFSRPTEEFDTLAHNPPENGWVTHPTDSARTPGKPRVFIGPIGSANMLVRNADIRDKMARQFGLRAFEMEGSGIADATWTEDAGYFVVRGTCDYCDSNKNNVWHNYAAAVAASYVRALLMSLPTSNVAGWGRYAGTGPSPAGFDRAAIVQPASPSSPLYAHAELDLIKSLLEKGKPIDAEVLATQLRERTWLDLSSGQRWRLCTLAADAKTRLGQIEEASKLIAEAYEHAPDSPEAAVNKIRTVLINGKALEAREYIAKAMAAFPQSAAVWAEYIEVSVSTADAKEAIASVPELVSGSLDVLSAISSRVEFGSVAEEAAKRCIEKFPDEMRSWHVWGIWLATTEFRKISPLEPGETRPVEQSQLELAIQAFTRMLELARKLGHKMAEVEALLQRSSVAELLGTLDSAQQDIYEALGIFPNNPTVLLHAGRIAEARGESNQAVDYLRRAAKSETGLDVRFFLGLALSRRTDESSRQESIRLLVEVAKRRGSFHAPALEAAVAGYLATRDASAATQLLNDTAELAEPIRAHALRARVAQHAGDPEGAKKLTTRALEDLRDDTPRDSRRLLAKVLMNLGQFKQALPLLQALAVPGIEDDTGRYLVDCALRTERLDIVLEYCKKARAFGLYDDFLLEREITLLERYHPEEAIVVLTELLTRRPEHHYARVNLAHIALREQKLDLVEAQLPLLPSVDLVDAHEGEVVVHILRSVGKNSEANKFAYDLLRRFFNSHHAHRAFRDSLLYRSTDTEIPDLVTVAPGTAVELSEDGHTQWHVLEDSRVEASGVENELDINSPLATLLLGKRLNEEVVLSDGAGIRRVATVACIVPKVAYRLNDVWNRWQYRFPDHQEVWVQKVETADGKTDFQSILDIAAEAERRDAQVLEIFRNNPLSVSGLAKALQVEETEALWRIAHLRNTPLRCCASSETALWFGYTALDHCHEIVLDLSAFATMAMLGQLELVAKLGKRLVISHECLYALRRLEQHTRFPFGFENGFGKNWNGATLFDFGQEWQQRRGSLFKELVEVAEKHCKVAGVSQVAQFPPEQRKQMESTLGTVGFYSATLAFNSNRALWTDDAIVAFVAESRMRVRRTWTQAVLRWMLAQDLIDTQLFTKLSSKLVGCGYCHTHLNDSIVLDCGNAASWQPDVWPLNECISSLRNTETDSATAIKTACSIVKTSYLELVVPESRREVLLSVLDTLATRPGIHNKNLDTFRASLPGAFGLNSVAAIDAVTTFDAWRAARPAIP